MATTIWLRQMVSIRDSLSFLVWEPATQRICPRVDIHIIAYCIGFVVGNLQVYFYACYAKSYTCDAFLTFFEAINRKRFFKISLR